MLTVFKWLVAPDQGNRDASSGCAESWRRGVCSSSECQEAGAHAAKTGRPDVKVARPLERIYRM